MNASTADEVAQADALFEAMIAKLRELKAIRSDQVSGAFRTIPRHPRVVISWPGRLADQEREFLGTSAIPNEKPVWNRLGMGVRAQGILAWAAPTL